MQIKEMKLLTALQLFQDLLNLVPVAAEELKVLKATPPKHTPAPDQVREIRVYYEGEEPQRLEYIDPCRESEVSESCASPAVCVCVCVCVCGEFVCVCVSVHLFLRSSLFLPLTIYLSLSFSLTRNICFLQAEKGVHSLRMYGTYTIKDDSLHFPKINCQVPRTGWCKPDVFVCVCAFSLSV